MDDQTTVEPTDEEMLAKMLATVEAFERDPSLLVDLTQMTDEEYLGWLLHDQEKIG